MTVSRNQDNLGQLGPLVHFGSCFTEVCFVIPEESQRLTSPPQAFTVPGKLTVTVETSLDLALVLEFILHLLIPLGSI